MDDNSRVRDHVQQELSEVEARLATIEREAAPDAERQDLVRRRTALHEELAAMRDDEVAAHEDPVTGDRLDERNIEDAVTRGLTRFR